jgi:hypothetical protein
MTFPLVIWYSLLFNPVTEVELHKNHCMIQLAVGFSRKWINTEIKEGSAINIKTKRKHCPSKANSP